MPKTDEEKAQEGLEKTLTAAGFQEGTPAPVEEGSQAMPPAPAPATEETPPVEAAKPPEPTEEVKRLQDENKALKDKGEWADRAQKAADRERQRAEKAEGENERLRTALGTPTKPTERVLTPEEQAQVDLGRKWLREELPGVIKDIPEEALAQHPAMKKMAVGLFMMGDELEKSRFISQFELKERAAVETRIIPALQQARQASGFKKGYAELFEEMKKSYQETAGIFGMTAPPGEPPPPPPTPRFGVPAPTPTTIPPSLSGVSGGGPPSGGNVKPLDLETARWLGIKTPGGT
jgi:hypothetical protein